MSQTELQISLEGLAESIQQLTRRVDVLQRSVDNLSEDKSYDVATQERLVNDVQHLKLLVVDNQKKTKENIAEVKEVVEQTGAVTRYSLVDELKAKFIKKNIEPRRNFFFKLFKRG